MSQEVIRLGIVPGSVEEVLRRHEGEIADLMQKFAAMEERMKKLEAKEEKRKQKKKEKKRRRRGKEAEEEVSDAD